MAIVTDAKYSIIYALITDFDNNFTLNFTFLQVVVIYFPNPKHKSVQRIIKYIVGLVEGQGGDFAGVFGLVFLTEKGKTFGLEVFARFYLDCQTPSSARFCLFALRP